MSGRERDDVRQEQPFVWLTLRAGGHFETCITAAHRAVRHLAGLKGYPTVPPNLSARLPATAPLLSGNGEQQIKDMRDAIQHQEKRILGTTKKELLTVPRSSKVTLGASIRPAMSPRKGSKCQ